MSHPDFSTYLSPFSWRYGSTAMRRLFSEEYKYILWRRIWVALATAEHTAGVVTKAELEDLQKNEANIDIERILELEAETNHDVVAAIKEFAEKAKVGGKKIHLGATSMDVNDNAETLRMHEALRLIEEQVKMLLELLAEKIETWKDVPTLGFTHLQPAEPTTVGYRLAFYAQDLLMDLSALQFAQELLTAKGMKGAVGTAASYQAILEGTGRSAGQLEKDVMEKLGLEAALISTQVYSRKADYFVATTLASIGSSLAKFAADLRILQSPGFGEWSEPFGSKQVGSSAMPFKKNPINTEKICSLARYLTTLPPVLLENASHSYLERTLDDSANRRVIIPEAFLTCDEILKTAAKVIKGFIISKERTEHNLAQYAPFIAAESIIIEAVRNGADRQIMHEELRTLAMQAWAEVQQGRPNPLPDLLAKNPLINQYLTQSQLATFLQVEHHVGDAPERAGRLVKTIRSVLKKAS
jgi:adenylosuccinate lyase